MGNMDFIKSSLIIWVFLSSTNSIPTAKELTWESSRSRCLDPGNDADAKTWFSEGQTNAEKDLDKFELIALGLKTGRYINGLLKQELTSLLSVVSEANDNTITSIATLETMIEGLHQLTGNPGLAEKLLIKLTAFVMDGKKNNKSYFLLNGAASWIELRGNTYLAYIQTPGALALITDFQALDVQILTARDTLDSGLQVIYEGMHRLSGFSGDIGANLKNIQWVLGNMKMAMERNKSIILKTSQDAVDTIKSMIIALN